jgi:hypothetical protein
VEANGMEDESSIEQSLSAAEDISGAEAKARPLRNVSKRFYLSSVIVAAAAIWMIRLFFGTIQTWASVTAIVLWVFILVLFLILLYKAWNRLPPSYARTTPGKAVGFSCIPLFNCYWTFQAVWGYSKDYNEWAVAQPGDTPRLSEGLFLWYSILNVMLILSSRSLLSANSDAGSFIAFGALTAFYVLQIIVINQICNAINTLNVKHGLLQHFLDAGYVPPL